MSRRQIDDSFFFFFFFFFLFLVPKIGSLENIKAYFLGKRKTKQKYRLLNFIHYARHWYCKTLMSTFKMHYKYSDNPDFVTYKSKPWRNISKMPRICHNHEEQPSVGTKKTSDEEQILLHKTQCRALLTAVH